MTWPRERAESGGSWAVWTPSEKVRGGSSAPGSAGPVGACTGFQQGGQGRANRNGMEKQRPYRHWLV